MKLKAEVNNDCLNIGVETHASIKDTRPLKLETPRSKALSQVDLVRVEKTLLYGRVSDK